MLGSNGSTAFASSSLVGGGSTRLSHNFNVSLKRLASVLVEAFIESSKLSSPKHNPMFSHSLANGSNILKIVDRCPFSQTERLLAPTCTVYKIIILL